MVEWVSPLFDVMFFGLPHLPQLGGLNRRLLAEGTVFVRQGSLQLVKQPQAQQGKPVL